MGGSLKAPERAIHQTHDLALPSPSPPLGVPQRRAPRPDPLLTAPSQRHCRRPTPTMPRIPTQPSRGSGSSPRHHPACSEATRGLSRPASVRRPDAPALRCARRMTPCSSAMPLARPGMRRPSELAPDRRPASSRAAVIIGSFRPRRLQSRAATSSPEPGLFAKLTRLSTLLSSPSRPDAWQPPRRGPPQSDQRRLITTAVRLQPERPEASRLITGPDTPGARASRRSCVARVVAENRWSAGPDRPPRGRLLYTATALDEHDPTNPSTREC